MFKKMITPVIAIIIYWILLIGTIIFGLVSLFSGNIFGLIILLLGPLLIRVISELQIILFEIHGLLVEITESNKKVVEKLGLLLINSERENHSK